MQASYLYTSGRVAILIGKLLSEEKTERIAESKDTDEALRLLFEAGYADGVTMTAADFEDTLAAQMREAAEFVSESSPERNTTDCFLLRADYLNAKMAMKCKYARKTPPLYAYGGLYDGEKLFEDIQRDNYEGLPPEMAEALGGIDEKFYDGARKPAVIDNLLDTAYYRQVARLIKNCKSAVVKEYFAAEADIKNILDFFRVTKANLGEQAFFDIFAEGGKLDKEFFEGMYGEDISKITEKFFQTDYKDFVSVIAEEYGAGAFSKSQAYAADYKKKIIARAKDNIEGIEPLVYYYLGKSTETENIRLILVCLKNGVDKQQIVKRLRESYV